MDLATLNITSAADQGAWFTPVHPVTGDELPIKIKLAGTDSARWIEEEQKYADKRFKQIGKFGKLPEFTSAEIEERGIAMLAAVTLAWENVEWDGKPAPCNEQNARVIYRNLKWLREQVDAFISDRSNFGDFQSEKKASVFNGEAIIAESAESFTSGQSGVTATAPDNGIQ